MSLGCRSGTVRRIMDKLIINLSYELPSEDAEELEDVLAIVMDCLGYRGTIDDSITGNTTVFPFDHSIDPVVNRLDKLVSELGLRLGSAVDGSWLYCPLCGSSSIFVVDDDNEMRECSDCGHLWETDNDED